MSNFANRETDNNLSFNVLSDKECKMIYDTSLRILEEVGVPIPGDNEEHIVRKTFEKAGCKIEGDKLFIPRQVVKDALAALPKEIQMYDQVGNPTIHFSKNNTKSYNSSALFPPKRRDLETDMDRPGLKRDSFETALVCDALDNIDSVGSMTWITDVPYEDLNGLYDAREMIKATNKTLTMHYTCPEGYRGIKEICAAIAGSWEKFVEKPFYYFVAFWDDVDILLDVIESGAPFSVFGSSQIGINTPASIAGMQAADLAVNLSFVVFMENYKPGTKFIVALSDTFTNFKTAGYTVTCPEWGLLGAVGADLYRYLDLPAIHLGGDTDSRVFDQQAAADYMFQTFVNKLCNVCEIPLNGYLESGLTSKMECLVLVDEICSYVNAFRNGIEVNEKTLSFDLIKKVGILGPFISEMDTVEVARTLWEPRIFTRDTAAAWEQKGSKDFAARAKERVIEIIAAGPQHEKSPKLLDKIDDIIAKYEKEYAQNHA